MAKRGRPRQAKIDFPKIGSNGGMLAEENRKKLSGYIAEIERINGQIDELKAEQKLMFDSAKDSNFDCKAIRAVVRERRIDKAKREAFENVCDAYRHALGMLADLPLGRAAIVRDLGNAADLPPAHDVDPVDTSDRPFAPPADEMPAAPVAPAA